MIVFEGLAFLPALRRSVQPARRRWLPVLLIFVILWLVTLGLNRLYGRYYDGAEGVFLLVPLSQILVWSFVSLVLDLLFIFLYEQVRNSRQAPSPRSAEAWLPAPAAASRRARAR